MTVLIHWAYSSHVRIESIPKGYWIWAGVREQDAPSNSTLYIYQGQINQDTDNSKATYERIGLFPYPVKAKEVYIVYRLVGRLPDPEAMSSLFKRTSLAWERHNVKVTGLQLDFDAPTSKLLQYGDFLARMRKALVSEKKLSVTGLGDWAVLGDQQGLSAIVQNTDEIIFQLYQGRRPLSDIHKYVRILSRFDKPFKVGLLEDARNNKHLAQLARNKYFNGVVYFILK